MCLARTSIDYHTVLIGDGPFLIPRQIRLQTLSPAANETDSVTTFSACHEYSAESTLRFDGGDDVAAKREPATSITLPAGVSLTLALLHPIDTGGAAAGDPVSAKVVKAVRTKDSKTIPIPTGAIAHGRILQMRHQYSASQFQISIRFDTLEINGVVSPLSVRLDRELKMETARTQNGLRNRATEFSLPPPASSEKGSLFVFPDRGGPYVMPTGSESKWTTLAK
jgi:hypothetical protein